jgi:DNA-binding LacI/PurR family transcriptional regulator
VVRKGRSVTIKDVAARAGVSVSTVSYVMSGRRYVSDDRRQRVLEAIAELDFVPHAGAQALRSRQTGVIGLAIPFRRKRSDRVLSAFIIEVAHRTTERGRELLLLTAATGTNQIRRVVRTGMVDGVVVMDVDEVDRSPAVLAGLGHPIVLMGAPEDPHGLPFLDLDTYAAGAMAAEWLLARGHREVGLLGGDSRLYERGTAYLLRGRRGVADAVGRAEARMYFQPVEPGPVAARRSVRSLLEAAPSLRGLVVHTDEALPYVAAVLAEERPGADVVAICADQLISELPVAAAYVPVPVAELARGCVDALLCVVEGNQPPSGLFSARLVEAHGHLPGVDRFAPGGGSPRDRSRAARAPATRREVGAAGQPGADDGLRRRA